MKRFILPALLALAACGPAPGDSIKAEEPAVTQDALFTESLLAKHVYVPSFCTSTDSCSLVIQIDINCGRDGNIASCPATGYPFGAGMLSRAFAGTTNNNATNGSDDVRISLIHPTTGFGSGQNMINCTVARLAGSLTNEQALIPKYDTNCTDGLCPVGYPYNAGRNASIWSASLAPGAPAVTCSDVGGIWTNQPVSRVLWVPTRNGFKKTKPSTAGDPQFADLALRVDLVPFGKSNIYFQTGQATVP